VEAERKPPPRPRVDLGPVEEPLPRRAPREAPPPLEAKGRWRRWALPLLLGLGVIVGSAVWVVESLKASPAVGAGVAMAPHGPADRPRSPGVDPDPRTDEQIADDLRAQAAVLDWEEARAAASSRAELEEALGALRRGLTPGSRPLAEAPALLDLAWAEVAVGSEAAAGRLDLLVAVTADASPLGLLADGLAAAHTGELGPAEAHLELALRGEELTARQRAQAALALARVRIGRGRFASAREALTEAEGYPPFGGDVRRLGRVAGLSAERPDLLRPVLADVAATPARVRAALALAALDLDARGEPRLVPEARDHAIFEAHRAVVWGPDDPWTLYAAAHTARLVGAPDTALSRLDRALAADPRFAAARLDRGRLRARQGDLPGAVEDLRAVVAVEALADAPPTEATPAARALVNLAAIAAADAQPDVALRFLEQATARGATRLPEYHVNRGLALLRAARPAEAVDHLVEARARAPDHPQLEQLVLFHAAALLEADRPAECLDLLDALPGPRPRDADLLAGHARYAREQWGGALDAYARYLDGRPGEPPARVAERLVACRERLASER